MGEDEEGKGVGFCGCVARLRSSNPLYFFQQRRRQQRQQQRREWIYLDSSGGCKSNALRMCWNDSAAEGRRVEIHVVSTTDES